MDLLPVDLEMTSRLLTASPLSSYLQQTCYLDAFCNTKETQNMAADCSWAKNCLKAPT